MNNGFFQIHKFDASYKEPYGSLTSLYMGWMVGARFCVQIAWFLLDTIDLGAGFVVHYQKSSCKILAAQMNIHTGFAFSA